MLPRIYTSGYHKAVDINPAVIYMNSSTLTVCITYYQSPFVENVNYNSVWHSLTQYTLNKSNFDYAARDFVSAREKLRFNNFETVVTYLQI